MKLSHGFSGFSFASGKSETSLISAATASRDNKLELHRLENRPDDSRELSEG
jgi:hypothetical protein